MKKAVLLGLSLAVASCNESAKDFVAVPPVLNPCLVGSVANPGVPTLVAHSGGYAYVFFTYQGLRVFDLENPLHPRILPAVAPLEAVNHFVLHGEYLFAAGGSGLSIFSLADPANPERVGFHAMRANGLAIDGDRAYVGGVIGAVSGLHIFDIGTLSTPVLLSTLDLPGSATAIAVSGSYAYVGVAREGFHVVAVADPLVPVRVGSFDIPGYLHEVRVREENAFVLSFQNSKSALYPGTDALWTIDIQAADSPHVVSVLTLGHYASQQLQMRGTAAYLARGQQEIQLLDLAHPESPQIARTISVPDIAMGLSVTDDHLIVSDIGGLYVIDALCGWRNGTGP